MVRISDVKRVSGSGGVPKKVEVTPKAAKKQGTRDNSDGSPAAHAFESLLADAVRSNASAVHMEPHGTEITVRYRVDGLLRLGHAVPVESVAMLGARIKTLANLDTKEVRVPQDGRFDIILRGHRYVVRAAFLPVADGEKIVLHLADESNLPHDLEQLGYWGNSLQSLRGAAEQPHGLVLVGGPAGSGKTSTLYGLVRVAADPTRNIATVEDIIEHRIPGVNQTPVNLRAGMTFAGALRAVLHQDPNVVVVGELREPETAAMALQTALAGRLVMAGVASHDLAATVSRITAMNIEPYLLASSARAVVNQRLVRRLCADCRESYRPAAAEIATALTACGLHPEGALSHLAEYEKTAAAELNVGTPQKVIAAGKVAQLWRAKAGGCAACGQTGYRGRIAIAEVMAVSPAIQKLIFSNASGMVLYDQAVGEGMVPLPMDGMVKVVLGITSIEEVVRVVTE